MSLDTRQGGSEQEFLFLLSWFLLTHTLSFFHLHFWVIFLLWSLIYLTDGRRSAKDGVRLAYKQDFKIAGTEKDFRAC